LSQKKVVIYFIVLVSALLAPLPLLNIFFLYHNGTLSNNTFNKKQLFTTDFIESNVNYILYKVYKASRNRGEVIVGKDDFLFLGNNYAHVIDKTQGLYPYTPNEIDTWTNKLRQLQDWYEAHNIKFVVVIAPNKHTVYRDKLPEDVQYKTDGTITDDIVKHAAKKSINILDLRPILIDNKNGHALYMSTDTHWNIAGAAIGYEATIAYLEDRYKIKLNKPAYIIKNKYKGGGDLANLLKIKTVLPDDYENVFAFNFDQNVCKGKIHKTTCALEKCKNVMNPVMFINSGPQYMINNNALNKQTLLWLCDSFAGAGAGNATNSKLYNASFQTIWKWHFSHINGNKLSDFVNKHKPDFVIYQIAERDLYNQGIVKELK